MISGQPRRPRPSVAVSGVLVLAVAVMHIVMIGCLSGQSMTRDSSGDPHVAHGARMTAHSGTVSEFAATASDCVMGDHGCVFVRADAVPLTLAAVLVLAVAPLAVAVITRLTRRGQVLGRSPPWAVLDHLQLSVIRR